MQVEASQAQSIRTVLSSLIQGGLSYLRWTQTVPMILAWSLAIFMMLAILLVGFQEESFAILEWLTESFPELADRLGQHLRDSGVVTDAESGGNEFTLEPLVPWVLRGWGIFAALLMIGEWLKQRLHPGTSQPRSLRRKLAILLGVVVMVLIIAAVVASNAGADLPDSVLPLMLMGTLLFGVSAYSLTVGHVIGKVQLALDEPAAVAQPVAEVDQGEFLTID